ncbi:hypothetical protein DVR11_17055 [Paracoccus versutus]|nr:hypothetical protein DVR11_17055 [Paracoccus versutus]
MIVSHVPCDLLTERAHIDSKLIARHLLRNVIAKLVLFPFDERSHKQCEKVRGGILRKIVEEICLQ